MKQRHRKHRRPVRDAWLAARLNAAKKRLKLKNATFGDGVGWVVTAGPLDRPMRPDADSRTMIDLLRGTDAPEDRTPEALAEYEAQCKRLGGGLEGGIPRAGLKAPV